MEGTDLRQAIGDGPVASSPQTVLFYDGTCGFCAGAVRFVLRRDRVGRLQFAPLQGEVADAVRMRHPELADIDSMVWVEALATSREQVHVRSAAALQVARYLGGVWRLAAVGRVIPAALRDALYAVVARHRHRLARGSEPCVVPSPEERSRFLG